jgi:hypothetical protein
VYRPGIKVLKEGTRPSPSLPLAACAIEESDDTIESLQHVCEEVVCLGLVLRSTRMALAPKVEPRW